MARLKVPMYQLFYDGDKSPEVPVPVDKGNEDWASHGKGQRLFIKLRAALSSTNEADRRLLLHFATKMADERRRKHR
jgi:hypothetical protein